MSLDIWLEEIKPTTVFDANFTHNVSRMWKHAGCYEALYECDGVKAFNVIPDLEKAIQVMEGEPNHFRSMDAANGWGTYDQALPWLRKLLAAFKEHPHAEIRVSK